MNEIEHIVQGFRASAVAAGLKKNNEQDLALIFSEREATVAGVFTSNNVKAAPVLLCRERVAKGRARAVVCNAGNANACTGERGMKDALMTADLVAEELGIAAEEVLLASTGVIGEPLDTDSIKAAVPGLVAELSPSGIPLAARAIMTTDSFAKISRFEGRAGDRPYRILGIAKGAGMIMPNMATMLAFILSDIRIDSATLQRALLSSVEASFNRITVDGDTSTNDTVLAMANGLAGNRAMSDPEQAEFEKGLQHVTYELARMIVQDGEGATKVVDIEVRGAASPQDAINAARTVANSSLVKTAFYGRDPNWGRIMAALGRAGIAMKEGDVDILIDDVLIVEMGLGKGPEAEKKGAERMARDSFTVTIDLRQGKYRDRITTCDLTHEYISINADYRS